MGRALNEDDIIDVANQEGLPGYQLLALADKENSNDESESGAGARGRFQLLPATFKAVYPTGNIDDPRDNAIAAARYYKQGLTKTGGDEAAAAGYYYAGPNFAKKIASSPGVKYGTNPDGSGGISIEDYQNQFTKNVRKYTGDTESPTTVAHVDDVNFMSDDLNSSIARVTDSMGAQLDKIVNSSQTYSDQIKQNVQDQMANAGKAGELQATIEMDKWGQQSEKAAQVSEELTRLGINTNDLDSTIAQISTEMNANFQQAQAIRADIRARQNVSFFDSPLDWLGNQFTLPSEIRQHNAIVEDIAAKKDYVDQATSTALKVEAANAGKFTTISYEGAKAAAELARTTAANNALNLQDKLLKTDLDTQMRTFGVLKAREQLLQQAELNQQKLKDKQTAEQTKAAEVERVNNDNNQIQLAGNMLGLNIPDRKSLEKKPKDQRAAVEYVMSNGGNVIGKDPLEALQVLKRGDPNNMPVMTKQQMDLLNTAYGQANALLQNKPEIKGAKPEVQTQFIKDQMGNLLGLAAADPNNKGLKINPYTIPSIDTMEHLPEIANSRIVALAKQFTKDLPNRELTDSQLYALAKANIGPTKAYTDYTDAAKDIAKYYQAGIKFNNAKVRFSAFGMKDQEDYNVRIGDDKVDLSSYSKVMANMLAADRNAKFLGRLPGAN